MKILFINKSDQRGGAAVVTRRLACAVNALGEQGTEARMLVQEQLLDNTDNAVGCYGSTITDKGNFLAERLQIFVGNGFSKRRLFLVDTAAFGRDLAKHEWVAWADVIVLGWINQGAMSLRGVRSLLQTGKPVVWMLHDLWPITGICHLPYGCERYQQQGCGRCKYLSSRNEGDLSAQVFRQKRDLYSQHKNLSFIAVSRWVKECFDSSALMKGSGLRCEIVHNALSEQAFCAQAHTGDITMVMGAARIDDPVKGFPTLLSALNELQSTSVRLVLYGGLRDKSLLNKIPIPYIYKGVQPSPEAVAQVMAESDIVLSCSAYETFGATLAEGIAAGCLAVTTGAGGQRDIVDHLRTGYIVEQNEPFANGLRWAIEKINEERASGIAANARQLRHDEMMRRFAPDVVARQFVSFITNA